MAFSEKTLAFLHENRQRNSKIWFEEHREAYEQQVLEPLATFARDLAPALLELDAGLQCEPKVGKCLSRIHRDTRFSRDKSFFRDVMWCVFMRDKKLYNGVPGFVFELSPRGYRYGCGYYQADGASMESIRRHILEQDAGFDAALRCAETQHHFTLEGDLYKRSRFPEADPLVRNWLDRKNICFIHTETDTKGLFAADLASRVGQALCLLAPVYLFLLRCETEKGLTA